MSKQKTFGFGHRVRCLYKGQSLLRILMNEALAEETLRGTVADIGGGRKPDYVDYIQKHGAVEIIPVDGSLSPIDFEHDALPFADASVDGVLLCNVLEHIYNHMFLVREIKRILKPDAPLIGFVPFWINYHPDPHDYFRYTGEALERIFRDAGFGDIQIRSIGGGPFLANFNTIVLSLPRILRPLLYPWWAFLDAVFVRVRPASLKRTPLGFIFVAHNRHA